MNIIEARVKEVEGKELDGGSHVSISHGMCIMEAVSYVAGEPWSDHPSCSCPVISAFLRTWNDALPDDTRNELLKPLVLRMVGTKSTRQVEERRSLMAADWLVRVQIPAWLRLAGLNSQAELLAKLPEITSMAQVPSIRGPIEAVRQYADAARDAAWAAARAAAWDAARDAARAAAWDAARDAARAAAWAKLAPTRDELQLSALALVNHMIDYTGEA